MAWNWDHTIDVIKVGGGLAAAVWALVQYGHQVEQEGAETVRHAIEVTHDATAKQFRESLAVLLQPFSSREQTAPFWVWRSQPGAPAPNWEFYESITFNSHDQEYSFVVTFFRQMYDYAISSPCTWRVVVDAFRQDAGQFTWYFLPTWDHYAERIRKDPKEFWQPVSAFVEDSPPASVKSGCGASLLEQLRSW
jgi:hypothetical protein